MEHVGGATKIVLLYGGIMFLWALLLGVLKYQQTVTSPNHRAHPYTDIAHRAALLYAFALLLVATFVELSQWSTAVNLVAASAMAAYFAFAVASYTWHGMRRDTANQFDHATTGTKGFMISLIVVEIGGWLVLLAGFVDRQFAH